MTHLGRKASIEDWRKGHHDLQLTLNQLCPLKVLSTYALSTARHACRCEVCSDSVHLHERAQDHCNSQVPLLFLAYILDEAARH